MRAARGLSKRALAKEVGISQSTYSDLENGRNVGKSLESFARIARSLGTSADYLLGITSDERAESSPATLSPLEHELLGLVREMRPQRLRALVGLARELREEEAREGRYDELVRAFEAMGQGALLERIEARLFALVDELGSTSGALNQLQAEMAKEFGLVAAEEGANPLEEA